MNYICNTANISSALYIALNEFCGSRAINWCGFYLVNGTSNELILGPFMGRPAVTRIPFDKGVCGATARELRSQVVKDVHLFPGLTFFVHT